jgi:hypothetical protein
MFGFAGVRLSDRNQVAFKEKFTIIDPVIKHNMLYIEKISSGDCLPENQISLGL